MLIVNSKKNFKYIKIFIITISRYFKDYRWPWAGCSINNEEFYQIRNNLRTNCYRSSMVLDTVLFWTWVWNNFFKKCQSPTILYLIPWCKLLPTMLSKPKHMVSLSISGCLCIVVVQNMELRGQSTRDIKRKWVWKFSR